MIVICHKPAEIIKTARRSCDDIYITTSNGPDLFSNFNIMYNCQHNFHDIIKELNSNFYNCTDGLDPKLHHGIFKYNIKQGTFIIIYMVYNSRAGF